MNVLKNLIARWKIQILWSNSFWRMYAFQGYKMFKMTDASNQYTFNHRHGSNQSISIGSIVLPYSGLIFTRIQSNSFIAAANAVLLHIFTFILQLFIGIPFIRSKHYSGLFHFLMNFWIVFSITCHYLSNSGIRCMLLWNGFDWKLFIRVCWNDSENSTNFEFIPQFRKFYWKKYAIVQHK